MITCDIRLKGSLLKSKNLKTVEEFLMTKIFAVIDRLILIVVKISKLSFNTWTVKVVLRKWSICSFRRIRIVRHVYLAVNALHLSYTSSKPTHSSEIRLNSCAIREMKKKKNQMANKIIKDKHSNKLIVNKIEMCFDSSFSTFDNLLFEF